MSMRVRAEDAVRGAPAGVLTAAYVIPLLAAAVAFAGSLEHDLVHDARFLITENRFMDGWRYLWGNLTHDYFWSSVGNAIPYWRPVTKGSWLVEAQLFDRAPAAFHAVQLLWHLITVSGVIALGRRLGLGALGAAVGGLLFGLHPVAVEPVCQVMARSDVVAAGAGVWALVAWLAWRETGRRGALAGHLLALALALGSKEVSVMLAPILGLWALLLPRESAGPWRLRVVGALRAVAPAVGLTALYLVGRAIVLRHTPFATPPVSFEPVRWFVAGGAYLEGLLPRLGTSGIRSLSQAEAHAPATLVGVTVAWSVVLGLAVAAWRLRAMSLLALLAWLFGALAPVLLSPALFVPGVVGKWPLADRWALQPAAAAALVLALLLDRGLRALRGFKGTARSSETARPGGTTRLSGTTSPGRTATVAVGLACAAWGGLALGAVRAEATLHRHERSLLDLEDRRFVQTPAAWRTQEDVCRFEERALARLVASPEIESAFARLAQVPPACLAEPGFDVMRLALLVQQGRFAEAVAVADRVLARPGLESRHAPQVNYLAGRVRLETGRIADAEAHLREAERLGYPGCNLPVQLGRVFAARGKLADAASAYERAGHCAASATTGRGDPRPFLAAAELWLAVQERQRAAAALGRARTLPLDTATAAQADRLGAALGR